MWQEERRGSLAAEEIRFSSRRQLKAYRRLFRKNNPCTFTMSGRQLDNWNGGQSHQYEYQQTTYSNQCAKPSKVTSRQIQANNRMAAAEVQQITRALSSNGQPNTVTYNYININHRYSSK